jgi:hypothetical protein
MQKHNAGLSTALALGLIVFVVSQAGRADNFQRVSYDPATDELVVVVAYSGTNPDHQFFAPRHRPALSRLNIGKALSLQNPLERGVGIRLLAQQVQRQCGQKQRSLGFADACNALRERRVDEFNLGVVHVVP